MKYSTTVKKARDYYDSENMLNFHNLIYGEHIHIGLYETGTESIPNANLRTLEVINTLLELDSSSKVLDIGSGYGGAARYLAGQAHCHVDCLNLSAAQNEINRKLTQAKDLDALIHVFDGSFQEIPAAEDTYDTVISQDALLYSSDRLQVFQEVSRVLQNKGQFLLTDVMLSDECPPDIHKKTLEIVELKSLASIEIYRALAKKTGFQEIKVLEMSEQVTQQYQKTLDALESNFDELRKGCDEEFLEYQRVRLSNWIKIGNEGYLNWGILHFLKL